MLNDIVGARDFQAVNLDQEEADRNVFEFDLKLWNLLHKISREQPEVAAAQFSLEMQAVRKLAVATTAQLKTLASGVLVSFRLETSEQTIITLLGEEYDPVAFINHFEYEFDAAYWLLLNRVASRNHYMAAEIFGISPRLTEMVAEATDGQLRHISGKIQTLFTLRFAPTTTEKILNASRKEVLPPVLLKLQQSLQGRVSSGAREVAINIGNSGTLGRWITARHMALAGYITKIIMIETGLTYKQVRRQCDDLEREGFKFKHKRKSRTARGGATLIHSTTSKIQASLLMSLYHNLGGEAVFRSIDITALNTSFRMYTAIRREVPGMTGARWEAFNITDAWCLAQELRSGDAMFEECDNCTCQYFTSINQRTSVECPFCKELARGMREIPRLSTAPSPAIYP